MLGNSMEMKGTHEFTENQIFTKSTIFKPENLYLNLALSVMFLTFALFESC